MVSHFTIITFQYESPCVNQLPKICQSRNSLLVIICQNQHLFHWQLCSCENSHCWQRKRRLTVHPHIFLFISFFSIFSAGGSPVATSRATQMSHFLPFFGNLKALQGWSWMMNPANILPEKRYVTAHGCVLIPKSSLSSQVLQALENWKSYQVVLFSGGDSGNEHGGLDKKTWSKVAAEGQKEAINAQHCTSIQIQFLFNEKNILIHSGKSTPVSVIHE